jgi:hypothetical protein
MSIELPGCNAHIAYIIYDARQCTAATALPRLFLVARGLTLVEPSFLINRTELHIIWTLFPLCLSSLLPSSFANRNCQISRNPRCSRLTRYGILHTNQIQTGPGLNLKWCFGYGLTCFFCFITVTVHLARPAFPLALPAALAFLADSWLARVIFILNDVRGNAHCPNSPEIRL